MEKTYEFLSLDNLTIKEFKNINIPEKYLTVVNCPCYYYNGQEHFIQILPNGMGKQNDKKPQIHVYLDTSGESRTYIEEVKNIVAIITGGTLIHNEDKILLHKLPTYEIITEYLNEFKQKLDKNSYCGIVSLWYKDIPKGILEQLNIPQTKIRNLRKPT